jgi:hypothetical protein
MWSASYVDDPFGRAIRRRDAALAKSDPDNGEDFEGDVKRLKKIENIVVIHAENRSFDNLYGAFPGANGLQRFDPAKHRQTDRDGSELKENAPFAVDGKPPQGFGIPLSTVTRDLVHRFYTPVTSKPENGAVGWRNVRPRPLLTDFHEPLNSGRRFAGVWKSAKPPAKKRGRITYKALILQPISTFRPMKRRALTKWAFMNW